MARIEIPTSPLELIALAEKVFKKHTTDGADSPLKPLKWTEVGGTLSKAEELREKAERLKREMNRAYEERDALLTPIDTIVRSSRDILMGIHKKEMRILGEWGYTVIDAPRSNGDKGAEKK